MLLALLLRNPLHPVYVNKNVIDINALVLSHYIFLLGFAFFCVSFDGFIILYSTLYFYRHLIQMYPIYFVYFIYSTLIF